jgi:chromate transporter
MRLTTLALQFLRIGSTGFGGPMSLIGLMEHHIVRRTDKLTEEDLAQGVAIGQILPGPVALGCAAHLGYRLRGFVGAIVSVTAMILPPFLLMLVISPLYLKYGRVPQVAAFFHGVGPAVMAVILATAWRMSGKCIRTWVAGAIAAAACAAVILKAPPGAHRLRDGARRAARAGLREAGATQGSAARAGAARRGAE